MRTRTRAHQAQTPSKSPVAKRSIRLNDRKTSVSVEPAFWVALREIAAWLDASFGHLAFSAFIKQVFQHAFEIERKQRCTHREGQSGSVYWLDRRSAV